MSTLILTLQSRLLPGQSVSLVTFQMNPSAGLKLDAGIYDVGDSQPADGTGLNEDKCLLRHTGFAKKPTGPKLWVAGGLWAFILSQKRRQIVSLKRNGSQDLTVAVIKGDCASIRQSAFLSDPKVKPRHTSGGNGAD